MLYFAYGSNMSIRRLRARAPAVRFRAVGILPGHRMLFHKYGRADGSAKCDAFHTDSSSDRVFGVVYDIDEAHKGDLDRVEGLGYGYDEKLVSVTTRDGGQLEVQLYVATDIDRGLMPYRWYWEHVRIGARENGLPAQYIDWIETVPVHDDPDSGRHKRELAIYTPADLHEATRL